MQKKTEQKITGLLNAHRRKKKWKALVLALSVLVLCNTFYALHQAAVAVSDKNAELAELETVVDEAMRRSAGDEGDTSVITAEFTTSDGTEDETTSSDDAYDETASDPSAQGDTPVADDPAEGGATDPAATQPSAGDDTNEDQTVIEDEDIPLSGTMEQPLGTDRAAGPLAAPMQRTTAQNISSAYPTILKVTDENGNKVTSVRKNSAVTVEIGWQIGDMSEIAVPGDYLDITLPSELDFPEGTGEFVMSETVYLPDGTIVWAGQIVATFTIKGNNMRVVHTLTAVQLNQAGRLASGLKVGEKEWMRVQISSVGIKSDTDFNPYITLNNQRVYNGTIQVQAAGAEQITDVDLNYFYVNGTVDGESVTVGIEDPVTIEIGWTWRKAFQSLTSGDWYEIELPEQITYQAMDETSTDQRGNVIRIEVTQRASDNRWVCRVTYETVQGFWNESSGRIVARGHFNIAPTFDSSGKAQVTLEAKVSGGTSAKSRRTRTVTLTKGSSVPDGVWHIRGGVRRDAYGNPYPNNTYSIYDIQTPHTLNVRGGAWNPVILFVVADHNDDLDKDPFQNIDVVDYEPGYSNYISAYCAEMLRNHPQGSGAYGRQTATTYDALSLDYNTHFSAAAKEKLRNFLPISYPYVSVEAMRQALGFNRSFTEAEAVSAVQLAIWICEYVGTGSWDSVYDWGVSGGNIQLIKDIADALLNYKAPQTSSGGTVNYEFDGEPQVEWLSETSARVTGKIKGGNVPESIKGVWTNGDKSVDVTFTNRSTGTFTATLNGISKSDRLELRFSGKVFGQGRVVYFRCKDKSGKQDLISAVSETRTVYFDWFYECTDRNVRVIKQWTDEKGNVLTSAPDESVEITLYRQITGGQPEQVSKVTLNKSNGFTYTWKDLPMKDANGNIYTYSIRETRLPSGYELVGVETDATDNGRTLIFTATNKKIEEKTKVTIHKSWEGADDVTKVSSKVQLYQTNANDTNRIAVYMKSNPTVTKSATGGDIITAESYTTAQNQSGYVLAEWDLSGTNSWEATFADLPQKDASGNTIRYVVREVSFVIRRANNQLVTYYVNADGSTYYMENGQQKTGEFFVSVDQPDMTSEAPDAIVHNTRNGTLVVTKKWLDQNGNEWTYDLPPVITVTLGAKQNGRQLTDAELKALLGLDSLQMTLTEVNNWIGSWSKLPITGMEYFISEVDTSYTSGGTTINDYDLVDPVTLEVINGKPVYAVYNPATGGFEVTLYNRRKPIDIEVIKVDKEDTSKVLQGAVFELYKQSDMTSPVQTITTGADGIARFEKLAHDTVYVLKETQAPEGYVDRFNAEPIIFRIEMINGATRIRIISGGDYQTNEVLNTGTRLTITVTNQRTTYELPEAGGMGTKLYTTGGMSLMLATLLMYSTWKFMQKKEKGGRKNP